MSLRRPTVACLSFISVISPLCGVALTPDCGIVHLFLPFEASLQTPDRFSVILLGFREDYRPTSFLLIMSCKYLLIECALLVAHNAFMHAFVISYVRTVLRVLSLYSPGLLIWPDVDEGDLMDEEFDSESDA